MKPFTKKSQDQLDDLIFENRNQSYGAYDLRTTYDARIKKAFSICLSVFTLAVFLASQFAFKASKKIVDVEIDKPDIDIWVVPNIEANKVNIIETKTESVAKPAENQYKPVEKVEKKKEEKKEEEVKKVDQPITNNTNPGTGTTTGSEITGIEGAGTGNGEVKTIQITNVEGEDIKTYAEEMPEFIGGEAALRKFINANFRVPSDLETNTFKISLYFVVNETGQVSNITITRGASQVLDEEAIRVMSKMPAWKPGKMNGRAVKVRYNIPINIKVQ